MRRRRTGGAAALHTRDVRKDPGLDARPRSFRRRAGCGDFLRASGSPLERFSVAVYTNICLFNPGRVSGWAEDRNYSFLPGSAW
jgi:hypothetical protein